MSERHKKIFSSLQSCLTPSGGIQLIQSNLLDHKADLINIAFENCIF